ncbi:8756_t:CDS:10 [Entrophospora sp. SA101]|nr:8756_t:CDS:10 [Entrophospora sp. SA101]CAJ0845675.1 13550_t:CDS:10 [Entrophospora sp. SA101]
MSEINSGQLVRMQNVENSALTISVSGDNGGALIPTIRRTSGLQAPIMLLVGHQGEIFTVRFNPSGQYVASGSFDRTILLWNTYGDCLNYGLLKGHSGAIMELQWSRDSSKIFSCSTDKTVGVWDVPMGLRIKKFKGHSLFVNSVSSTRRGNEILASGSDDGSIKIWDLRQKDAAETFIQPYQITSTCFSEVWDVRKKEISYVLKGHQDTITGLRLSNDGSYLLSNAMDNTGAPHGFEKNLIRPAWSSDDSQIASGGGDRTVVIWDVSNGRILYKLPGHKGSVNEVDFHPKEPIMTTRKIQKLGIPFFKHEKDILPGQNEIIITMGRKEFIEDVKKLKEHFRSLNQRSASLVKDFDFQDPELSFKFEYKRGKSFTVQIFVNDGSEEDANSAAKCLSNVCVDNKSVCEIVATIVPKLCDHFKIALPRDLSMSSLKKFCRLPSISSTDLRKPIPQPLTLVNPREESSGKASKSIAQTPLLLLNRDMSEVRHFKYNAELLCADEMGFKIAVSMPVSRLGLSLEACDAWNLDPDRFIVCTMQFSPSYIDLQGVISNACQTKAYLIKEAGLSGGYNTIKESLKKQFPVNFAVMTSSLPRGMPSQSHHKDENLENDHFILSWTLTELLGDKFFDMLCDRIWFGIGWSGAEYADLIRKRELVSSFLNDEKSIYDGQIDDCLTQDEQSHTVLYYLESEKMESSSASRNQNFLLLLLQFLRRRILLSTRYCLTCHYPHTESVSSIRPFVCGSALCQHQALVGLGNLFEYDLINSPVVVDLLISLCHIAISLSNLNPCPSKAIGVTISSKHTVQNSLIVSWDANQGTIGIPTEKGYRVSGWKTFEGEVCVNDLLEVYHPENEQPFTVNRCSPTTTVRVLEVATNFIITDFPIIVPKTSVPTRHVYLPFRVYRREEKNFLNYDDTPNYKLLKHVIALFPSVRVMVEYAKKKTLKSELDKLDPLLFPLLSWIISSNRTHLRLLESEDEKVQLNDTNPTNGNWKQFVMIMSSPEKEQTFQNEKKKLGIERGGQSSGELYAFHGSPIQNWHSIIRTSLNTKKVSHGRVYGDGIYHSLQAATSTSYTGASHHRFDTYNWKNSMLNVIKCMALCEIINRPTEFTSTHPHLVVRDESWVTTRYLFVECRQEPIEILSEDPSHDWSISSNQNNQSYYKLQPSITLNRSPKNNVVVYITLDPKYTPIWLNGQQLKIPKCDFSIISNDLPINGSHNVGEFFYNPIEHQKLISDTSLNSTNKGSIFDDNIDEEDEFNEDYTEDSEMNELDDSDDQSNSDFDGFEDDELDFGDDDNGNEGGKKRKKEEEEYSNSFDPTLLPLPECSSKAATQRICRELKSIIQRQNGDSNDSNDYLGFFINVDLIQSVYQWVVQLKDFDRNLPLAQDMVRNKINTIDLEVRFAPDYPFVPPYIRVIRPRLLRFADGGGGHVTAGGSICMDLLTLGNQHESGWSSVYTMEAVLLQVKMALSSLEPRPARLDRQWYTEYSPAEAIESYIRVANQHNWSVPPHWAALFGR